MVSTGVACTLPNSGVLCSGSSGVGKGMSICKWGCLSLVTLELLCSGFGKLMKPTGHTHSSLPDRQLMAQWIGACGL